MVVQFGAAAGPGPRSAAHRASCDAAAKQHRGRRHNGASRKKSIAARLCASLAFLPGAAAWLGIPEKRFGYEGLIPTGSLGLPQDVTLLSLVDFDADQFVDVLTLSDDQTRVEVRLWDHENFSFRAGPYATITAPDGRRIVNAVAADFNYDGKPDVLLMMQQLPGEETKRDSELEMQLWLGEPGDGFQVAPYEVPSSLLPQPLTFDASGDMQADLIGHSFASRDGKRPPEAGSLDLWRNAFFESNNSRAFEVEGAGLTTTVDGKPAPACNLASPHSSGFIDLNGDCLADLFLVCSESGLLSSRTTYQVWTATKPPEGKTGTGSPAFLMAKSGDLPAGVGALSFADMDRDGTIDIVFPTCDGTHGECYINIAHNRQMPLCAQKSAGSWFGVGPGGPGKSSQNQKPMVLHRKEDGNVTKRANGDVTCRPADQLCLADPDFSFDFDTSGDNPDLTRIPVSAITGAKRLLLEDDLVSPAAPLPIALGDHNKDGYPDAAIVTLSDPGNRYKTQVHLLRSVPCRLTGESMPGCPKDPSKRAGRRTFETVKQGAEVLRAFDDVRRVTFFDVDEDGSLDLVLQRRLSRGPAQRLVTFVQNNYFHDAFFLKALTLNGACQRECEPSGKPRFKPWGVNYGGASFKFTVLDTNGMRRAQQVGQLPQNTYRSLHTPYSYFGLGRTNNYVESLYVGSTRRQRDHFLTIEGVIPNSQIVIAPWQGGPGAQGGGPSQWLKELYLTPGDWIPWVTVVLLSVILILSSLVLGMHVNERREDEREKRQALHAINFDAL